MAMPVHVVCIVDADDAVREGLGRLVESAGLEAVSCASIEDLLRQAGGGRLGCVLLDLDSPGLSLPKVRSRLSAATAGVPIIALSARDEPSMPRLARELGAQALFRKPVDATALLDSIDWLIRAGSHSA